MTNYEIEFKFEISESLWKKLLTTFPENSTTIVSEEIDTYYENKGNNKLAPEDKALRIRKSMVTTSDACNEEKTELTFKGPKVSEKSKTRNEINLKIGNMKKFDFLLQQLGFNPEMKVKKVRTVVKLLLPKSDIYLNLSYDIVENLGNFIEIETFTGNFDQIVVIEEKIMSYWNSLLDSLDITEEKPRKSIRESYLELLIRNEIRTG
ncbi:MAG: class IV adenylate cyclase [Candidatus Hodarchaeales archaeon]|jgi:adenylate cyclase class 2